MGGVLLGFFFVCLVCLGFLKARCMVVCEELVTGFVVVIVRIGLLVFGFFVFFICFVKEMEKSKNAKWNSRIPLWRKEWKPVSLNRNKQLVSTISSPPVGLPWWENRNIYVCALTASGGDTNTHPRGGWCCVQCVWTGLVCGGVWASPGAAFWKAE